MLLEPPAPAEAGGAGAGGGRLLLADNTNELLRALSSVDGDPKAFVSTELGR